MIGKGQAGTRLLREAVGGTCSTHSQRLITLPFYDVRRALTSVLLTLIEKSCSVVSGRVGVIGDTATVVSSSRVACVSRACVIRAERNSGVACA